MKKMKRFSYLIATIILIVASSSCNKDMNIDDDGVNLKTAYVLNWSSRPISLGMNVTPYILAVDKPRGGNVTCTDVEEALAADFDMCSERLNYGNYDLDPEYEFSGAFPEWLDVTVTDGKFVSFTVNNSGAVCYKVGAVIVKGGNSANVYYYADGTLVDNGLGSPINSSGSSAALSNLTFCFFKCESEPLMISVKSFYWAGTNYDILPGIYAYAASSGKYIFNDPTSWCSSLGMIEYYGGTLTVPFLREPYDDPTDNPDMGEIREIIGTVKIESTETNSIKVTVSLKEGGLLDRTYVYVGTEAGLYGSGSCPEYTSWPNQDYSDATTHIFNISY